LAELSADNIRNDLTGDPSALAHQSRSVMT